MEENMSDVLKIQSLWKCIEDINNVCFIHDNKETEKRIQEQEERKDLHPVSLMKPLNELNECTLSFKCFTERQITFKKIEVLSDVKMIEIYHRTDGYLLCMRGKPLGEKKFCCSSSVEFDCKDIYLKFPVRTDVEKITVYKITVNACFGELSTAETFPVINLDKVKDYLGDIPENAKGLYKNMEAYQKNQQSMSRTMMTGNMNIGSFGMMGLMSALMLNKSIPPSTHLNGLSSSDSIQTNKQLSGLSSLFSIPTITQSNGFSSSDSIPTSTQLNGLSSSVREENDVKSYNRIDTMETKPTFLDDTDDRHHENESNECEIKQVEANVNSGTNDVLGNDVINNLLNGVPLRQEDTGMFSMLKDICGKVSKRRDSPLTEQSLESKGEKGEISKESGDTDLRLKMICDHFEQNLQETEERLKIYVDVQLSSLEERLNLKLDRILTYLSNGEIFKPP